MGGHFRIGWLIVGSCRLEGAERAIETVSCQRWEMVCAVAGRQVFCVALGYVL